MWKQLGRLLSIRFAAIGLTFLQTLVMTRLIGRETFGSLSFALSVSALAVLVLSIGLDQLMMRDVARSGLEGFARSGRWLALRRLIGRWQVPLVLGLAVGFGALFLGSGLGGGYGLALAGVALALPLVLGRKYVESVALGAKLVGRSILGSQIAYPVLMILGTLAIWGLGVVDLRNVMLVYGLAIGSSLLVSILLIWPVLQRLARQTPRDGSSEGEIPGAAELLRSGWHFSLISLGFVLGQHMDVLLTGVFAGPDQVALVRVASRVAEMAGLVRAIVILQYKPQLAEAFGRGDLERVRKITRLMVAIFVVTGLPITLGLWIWPREAMSVFGAAFAEGAWAMRIYVLGVLFVLLAGPCNSVLSMIGEERWAARAVWMALAVNLGLDLLLIPAYGALGCAIANACSMLVIAGVSVAVAWRKHRVNTTITCWLNGGSR
ncbi:oligosaccharide flippase family protein [Rhodobacter xanthinilyticus]|uniref:oligosaccharide flippase family protein n=1 Tax=Rhodobacter xanthinilyticus TaxID=1850250 RepID=UPI0018DDA880|nr:polysaccharide biosynthesis C-terminal domain-containing protein [Rhodobacter xanthinilyticus]